jgi:TonB-dependent receptor
VWDSSAEDRDEQLAFYSASDQGLNLIHGYDFEYGVEGNKRALMGNLAYRLGNNTQLQLRSLFTGNSQSEGRFQKGFFSDINGDIEDYRLRYQEKEILNVQLSGDHFFSKLGSSGSLLEWRVSESSADSSENLRENLYNENQGEFRWRQIGQSGFMFFNDLKDDLADSRLDWSTMFAGDRAYGSFKVGGAYTQSDRDFDGRRFRFDPRNTRNVDLTAPAETLFSFENIGTAFVLNETTDVTDSYTAGHDITGAYAQADYAVGKWRFVGGVRFEDSQEQVITLDRRVDGGTPTVTNLDENEILPAFSIVYSLSNRQALRGSISRTVNRPEFRELAPFEFAAIAGGFLVVGNPELTSATVDSADVRWEWFPSPREVLAASVFYKSFEDPIEAVVIAGAQQTQTFTNARKATNVGFELELRRGLDSIFAPLENWLAIVNYTFVDSEIEIDPERTAFTDPTRPLSGQPDNVVNFVLEWSPRSIDGTLRTLYNFTDDKIFFAGSFGLPDIIEDGRGTLDLVWQHGFQNGLNYKVSASNLLDEDRTWSQGGLIHRQYSPGTGFGLSLGYSF